MLNWRQCKRLCVFPDVQVADDSAHEESGHLRPVDRSGKSRFTRRRTKAPFNGGQSQRTWRAVVRSKVDRCFRRPQGPQKVIDGCWSKRGRSVHASRPPHAKDECHGSFSSSRRRFELVFFKEVTQIHETIRPN